ncbi:MAG: hypothetical protein WC544_04820 [Patescibacteria group bacterium]
MTEQELPTPEEVRKELAEHLTEEESKDPDFWKKHDARVEKERQANENPQQ